MKRRKSITFDQNKNYNKNANVFIVGLRGYTQNYGGWETFAHGLLDNWKNDDIQFYVFEKVGSPDEEETLVVNNVVCFRVYEPETNSSSMMKYDMNCTLLATNYIVENEINNPVLYHLGVRIGPYLYFKKRFFKKRNIKLMENPAGAEWRRTKWNKLAQVYLFISAYMMAKSTDLIVCDNQGIRELYVKMINGKKPKIDFIPYGVYIPDSVSKTMPDYARNYFLKWGIFEDEYYLVLGRFVPENNYEKVLNGFISSKTNKKLIIISNYKTEFQKFYNDLEKKTGFEADQRIIMAGTLYDRKILSYVRQHARGYIHGHSVGGTNPGLLEAMAETKSNIVYDVNFNKYVGEKSVLYFKSEKELKQIIETLDDSNEEYRDSLGAKAKKRMRDYYSWKYVVSEYERVILDLIKN